MKVLISLLFVAIAGLLITTTVINMRQVSTPASKGDVVMFEKPQQEINVHSFEIMQVLPDGSALATVEDISNIGMIVLFLADKEISYYDNQKIDVPSDKRVMQVGTYKYISRSEMEKTVPIVEIMDK